VLILGSFGFGLVAGWWLLLAGAGRPPTAVVAGVAVVTLGVSALVAGAVAVPAVGTGLVAGAAAHAMFRWAVRRSTERGVPQ
jgi:hypothetical protein